MRIYQKNGRTIAVPEGRIDTVAAPEFERELFAGIDGRAVTLDLSKTEYISSAVLRVILRLKKAKTDVEIVNVPENIYEVLEMTDFTECIKVTRAGGKK